MARTSNPLAWRRRGVAGGTAPLRGLAATGLALAITASLDAQVPDQDALAAQLLQVLETPIASASKHLQKAIESPQAVEVITAEEIRAAGVFRLVDVLRLAPSVQVWDMAGERTNLTLRGVSPSGLGATVQVLVDGVPLFNASAMPIDFNGLPVPVAAIERVEIVRGPSSSLYGANAQMGVIAITTRKAGRGPEGSLRAGAANDGIHHQEAFFSYGRDLFSISAGASGESQRNLGRPLGAVEPSGLSMPFHDGSHGSQAYVRPEATPWRGGKLWAAFGHGETGHLDQTATLPDDFTPLAVFPDRTTVREIAQAGWAQTWSPVFRTELQVDQKTFKFKEGGLLAIPGSVLSAQVVQDLEAATPGLEGEHDVFYDRVRRVSLQANWDPTADVHLVGGLDASKIRVSNVLLASGDKEMDFSASGGFLSLDWRVGPANLSAGVRLGNETLGGTSASPRASLVWTLQDGSVLRAGFFTSSRSPMATEKVFSTPSTPLIPYVLVQNPGLRAEQARDYEIGYRKAWPRVSLDFTVFVTELRKIIVLAPAGSQAGGRTALSFLNDGHTYTDSGIEASFTATLGPGLVLGGSASTARFKDPVYDLDQQADYSPKAQGSLWLRYHLGILFAYASIQETGSYSVVVPGGQARTDIGSSTQVNFNVGIAPAQGLTVSLYGVGAAKGAQETSNMGFLNQNALRYSRRELGLQTGLRF